MIIVGFDQAPSGIGYCYGEAGEKPIFGWHELQDFGNNTARLGKSVREWASTFLKSCGAEIVYFEQVIPPFNGQKKGIVYAKQITVVCNIETGCSMLGLDDHCYEIKISDWRTEFYAGMRPPKNCRDDSEVWKSMALKECARRNWFTDNHNAAEACGIWDWACKANDKAYRLRSRVDKRRQQSGQDAARHATA